MQRDAVVHLHGKSPAVSCHCEQLLTEVKGAKLSRDHKVKIDWITRFDVGIFDKGRRADELISENELWEYVEMPAPTHPNRAKGR